MLSPYHYSQKIKEAASLKVKGTLLSGFSKCSLGGGGGGGGIAFVGRENVKNFQKEINLRGDISPLKALKKSCPPEVEPLIDMIDIWHD